MKIVVLSVLVAAAFLGGLAWLFEAETVVKVGKNFYKIRVPRDGAVRSTTVIRAQEPSDDDED